MGERTLRDAYKSRYSSSISQCIVQRKPKKGKKESKEFKNKKMKSLFFALGVYIICGKLLWTSDYSITRIILIHWNVKFTEYTIDERVNTIIKSLFCVL